MPQIIVTDGCGSSQGISFFDIDVIARASSCRRRILAKDPQLTESIPPMSGVRFKTVTFVQIVYSIEVTSTQNVIFGKTEKVHPGRYREANIYKELDSVSLSLLPSMEH